MARYAELPRYGVSGFRAAPGQVAAVLAGRKRYGHRKPPARQPSHITIMGAVSQWEREVIGEHTKDAMEHKKSNRECIGNIAYVSKFRLPTIFAAFSAKLMSTTRDTAVLLIDCPDPKGLVAAVASL